MRHGEAGSFFIGVRKPGMVLRTTVFHARAYAICYALAADLGADLGARLGAAPTASPRTPWRNPDAQLGAGRARNFMQRNVT